MPNQPSIRVNQTESNRIKALAGVSQARLPDLSHSSHSSHAFHSSRNFHFRLVFFRWKAILETNDAG